LFNKKGYCIIQIVKNLNTKASLVKFLILGILFIPLLSLAESQITLQEQDVSFEVFPENPQPYEKVSITIKSYATNLNKAIISWQNEKGNILSGIGETSYTFIAPGPNSSIYFDVVIKPVGEMNTIKKKIVINPSEIDIMWESVDGYTPPFYKGKSLPSSGSVIKVVAIPNTNTIKYGSGSLEYKWKNNDKTIEEASGYNKNSYIFKNSILNKTNEIKVIASSVSGNYGAERSISIPVFDPKLIFYKKSPTEGIFYNESLNKEYYMQDSEITLIAEPYYLSLNNNNNSFSYEWQINNDIVSTPSKERELTIRPTSRKGIINIDLTMEDLSGLFQIAKNKLKITL